MSRRDRSGSHLCALCAHRGRGPPAYGDGRGKSSDITRDNPRVACHGYAGARARRAHRPASRDRWPCGLEGGVTDHKALLCPRAAPRMAASLIPVGSECVSLSLDTSGSSGCRGMGQPGGGDGVDPHLGFQRPGLSGGQCGPRVGSPFSEKTTLGESLSQHPPP